VDVSREVRGGLSPARWSCAKNRLPIVYILSSVICDSYTARSQITLAKEVYRILPEYAKQGSRRVCDEKQVCYQVGTCIEAGVYLNGVLVSGKRELGTHRTSSREGFEYMYDRRAVREVEHLCV
jgi:hypothetical protein